EGREVHAAVVDPIAAELECNGRAMIDVDYRGSPLIADHASAEAGSEGPHPGQRYPDWTRFSGPSQHVLVFGPVADSASLTRLGRRWSKARADRSQPGRRSRPRRPPVGWRGPDPPRWSHRLQVSVRRS